MLGRVVFFYTKCTRVEAPILKIANKLVSDWMRPIIRRSKAYADKDEDLIELNKPTKEYTDSRKKGVREERGEEKGIARRHARIPEMLTASFSISPALEARDRGTSGSGGASVANGGQKFKDYKKKLLAGEFFHLLDLVRELTFCSRSTSFEESLSVVLCASSVSFRCNSFAV